MDLIDPYRPEVPPGQDELPYSDGEPMESYRHVLQMQLLMETLAEAWHGRDDYFLGGNMFVYFSELQARGEVKVRGPDVFVVLGTDRKKQRKSWVAWQEEGKLPDIVVELLSPSTEAIDRGEKMRIYSQIWRTAHYVLFDPVDARLDAYRLAQSTYEPISPDARGDMAILGTGLALGRRDLPFRGEPGPWLRWIDEHGEPLPTGAERAGAMLTSRDERAEDAERVARAATEEARAATEEARAATERARAAEHRIAELEAKLREGS